MARWHNSRSMKKSDQDKDEQTKTSLRLPIKLLEQAKIRAIRERRTLQDIAIDALEAYLKTPIERER